MLNRALGYTLVELMIALSLGLLVVAAGFGILIGGHRVLDLQSSVDELQENASLGLALIAFDLSQINLNTPSPQRVNPWNAGAGIIFDGRNLPTPLSKVPKNIWTAQDVTETVVDIRSDQLLIQYVPSLDLAGQHFFNCEGEELDLAGGQRLTVVNRYYLRKDPQQKADEDEGYALYCDSGYYREGDQYITGLSAQGGAQIVKRVEAFKLRLAVQNPVGQIAYMYVKDYLAMSAALDFARPVNIIPETSSGSERPNSVAMQGYNVVGVEIGLLVRASTALRHDSKLAVPLSVELMQHNIKMKAQPQSGKLYLRQSMSQMVAIRNALAGVTT